jgi:hypothetical protein
MIPVSEVALVLRGWAADKRRLRVIARLGLADLSVYCSASEVNEAGGTFTIEGSIFNMFSLSFEGYRFEFTDAPPDDNKLGVPGEIESGILCVLGTH